MINVTPAIANRIYDILVNYGGAANDENLRWSFCHSLPMERVKAYNFDSAVSDHAKIFEGNPPELRQVHDPRYPKFQLPEWQIKAMANINARISLLFRNATT